MKGPAGFKLEAEQAHAYLTARIARELIEDPDLKDEAFLAGILANIGRLVMAYQMTDLYEEVQAIVMAEGRPWAEVELELMGASHAQVGAYLLGLWGLPDSIVEAVAFHLHPGDFPHGEVGLIEVVHLAEHFAAEIEEAEFPDDPRRTNPLDLERLAATGLDARLDELRSRARRVATSADQAA
jgi:HD-like signal output (HDOD) protein